MSETPNLNQDPSEQIPPAAVSHGRIARVLAKFRGHDIVQTPVAAGFDVAETGYELSGDTQNFWEGEGYVKPAKTFDEQLDEINNDPTSHTNIIKSQSDPVLARGPSSIAALPRTKYEFTEAEGMKDLDDFLQRAIDSSAIHGRETSVSKMAKNFREQFTFLDDSELLEATAGIAQMWLAYMQQSPNHIINILPTSKVKSHGFLTQKVIEIIESDEQTAPIRDRLKVGAEAWIDTDHAKFVTLDDWMAGGDSARVLLANMHRAAKVQGIELGKDKLEAHLLIGRAEQEQILHEGARVPVRSYFQVHGSTSDFKAFPISGAHASVDNGFEFVIDTLNINSQQYEPPLLTYIQRSYGHDLPTPEQEDMLRDIAQDNARVTSLEVQLDILHDKRKAMGTGGTDQEREALLEEIFNCSQAGIAARNQKAAHIDKYDELGSKTRSK